MPSAYTTIPGKLCTRYSELINCTGSGMERVLDQRFNLRTPMELEQWEFGSIRHKMLERKGHEIGEVPAYFGVGNISLTHIEQPFSVEAFPGVVIQFTPDLIGVSKGVTIIGDYKMWRMPLDHQGALPTAWKLYKDSVQLDFYSWLLTFMDIQIKEKIYMVEMWNYERTKILGHDFIRKPLTIADKGKARAWAIPRVKRLMAGIKIYKEQGYCEG